MRATGCPAWVPSQSPNAQYVGPNGCLNDAGKAEADRIIKENA